MGQGTEGACTEGLTGSPAPCSQVCLLSQVAQEPWPQLPAPGRRVLGHSGAPSLPGTTKAPGGAAAVPGAGPLGPGLCKQVSGANSRHLPPPQPEVEGSQEPGQWQLIPSEQGRSPEYHQAGGETEALKAGGPVMRRLSAHSPPLPGPASGDFLDLLDCLGNTSR